MPEAVEYPIWQERYTEALAHFGTAIEVGRGRDLPVEAWMDRIAAGLTRAIDDLSAAAQTQDATRFDAIVGGNVGVGVTAPSSGTSFEVRGMGPLSGRSSARVMTLAQY